MILSDGPPPNNSASSAACLAAQSLPQTTPQTTPSHAPDGRAEEWSAGKEHCKLIMQNQHAVSG